MWALAEKVFFLIKMETKDSGKRKRGKYEIILPGGMLLVSKRGSGEDEASLKGVEGERIHHEDMLHKA